jgi:Tol biopolymer transport system component
MTILHRGRWPSGGIRGGLLSALCAGVIPAAWVGAVDATNWDVTDTGQPSKTVRISVQEGTWMSVDVSPDGGTLAFDLLGDIYTLPAGGGEASLVHGGPAMQRNPSFSADGRRMLYLSDASGADNAWISGIDGSAPRQVTHEKVNMLASPAWGPNEETVVLVQTDVPFPRRNAPKIRLFDLAGGTGRVLVAADRNGSDVQEPVFSRDGRHLYFTERINPAAFVHVDANHLNYAVQRRDLETGVQEQLIGGFGGAVAPRVSPDGRRVAFVRRVKEKTVLFVYETASGAQRPVHDQLDRDAQASYGQQSAYYPRFAWFPDNRHVAIWGQGKLLRIDTESGAAYPIPFRASAQHTITLAPRFEQDLAPSRVTVRTIRQLAPAADGTAIVFTALGHLWRQQLPSGTPVRLTQASALEFEPAWSADGRQLAYVEWDDERGSALKVLRGARTHTALTSTGLIREPEFSPDGKLLTYRLNAGDKTLGGYRNKPGIYVIPAAGGTPRFLAEGTSVPRFSPDGKRIYFGAEESGAVGTVRKLVSVTTEGFDRREHAVAPDADTVELRISPDLRWITFREQQQYYVVRYAETGVPLVVGAASDAQPVTRLTRLGGNALTWSSDSRAMYWTLGAELFRATVAGIAAAGGPQPAAYARIDLSVPADVPEGSIAFTGARLITMRGDEVIERGTVVVNRNRIAAVGPSDAVAIPRGARVIDASALTIIPGLIDMHGHNECCDDVGVVSQKQPQRYAQLAFGITTNFDPYSYSSEQLAYESNEMSLAGMTVSPRWLAAGNVIYGRPQMVDASYIAIHSMDDARAVMERKLAMGGTFIKSYRQPTRAQRQMLVKAAREAGLMVDIEGEGQFNLGLSAILDGHTGLEHNLPVATYYDDVVSLMREGTTSNTPTLVIIYGELFGENYLYQTQRAWLDPKVRSFVQAVSSSHSPLSTPDSAPMHARSMTTVHADEALWDVGVKSVSRSIRKLDDAGVTVNAGGHGQVAGLSMHWEMWLLAAGGMSNHRVLRAATMNGAGTLALDGQIGSLEVGKLADLVVLEANPLEDIRNTKTARYTMLNGRLYESSSMNEVGNHDRPRTRFYWELPDYRGIDWNESWTGQ